MRFMQNAARAKQLAQAELEQAKVKDEAEWEVPTAIRELWGTNGSTRQVSHTEAILRSNTKAYRALLPERSSMRAHMSLSCLK
jgi:hypothetical protein